MALFAGGPPNREGIKYFDYYFAITIFSPNTTFVPSLIEIGYLSCTTSCLDLPGFLMVILIRLHAKLISVVFLGSYSICGFGSISS